MGERMKQRYFAYGSNLNGRHLREQGFPAEKMQAVGVAYLPDYELCFSRYSQTWQGGVLDVRPRAGAFVSGVVFEIDDDIIRLLDRKEGAPSCYEQRAVEVFMENNTKAGAITYMVPDHQKEDYIVPSENYLGVVSEGYVEHNLPGSSLARVAEGAPGACDLMALFVYGTLMRGEIRERIVREFDVQCWILGELGGELVECGSYPGLLLTSEKDRWVQGEFVRFGGGGSFVSRIDEIEGFNGYGQEDNLFERRLIECTVGDGRIRLAWTYVYKGNGSPILSGDWRQHSDRREVILSKIFQKHLQGRAPAILLKNLNSYPYAAQIKNLRTEFLSGQLSERRLAQVSGQWH